MLLGLVLLLGACSWVGSAARNSVEGVASHFGRERFTLVVSVPPNFGFTSKAQYAPKEGQNCEIYSPSLGGSVTRQQQKYDKFPAKSTEQTVSIDIPLEYRIVGCSMELSRVNYDMNATYGLDTWDHDLAQAGGLSIPGPSSIKISDNSVQRGLCTWLFQINTAKTKKGEIEKILSCTAADAEWKIPEDRFKRRKSGTALARVELGDKTILVTFRQSPEEEPSYQAYWNMVPNGRNLAPAAGTQKEKSYVQLLQNLEPSK